MKRKYLVLDPGPDGITRVYIRRAGKRKIRILEPIGSEAFEIAYSNAVRYGKHPLPPPAPRYSFIYIAGSAERPVKVGISVDPDARLKRLRSGNPTRLKITHLYRVPGVAARPLERLTHEALADYRLFGEWFDVSAGAAEVALVEAARSAVVHIEDWTKLEPKCPTPPQDGVQPSAR